MPLLRRSRSALAALSVVVFLAGLVGSAALAVSAPSIASAETAHPPVTVTATVHSHTYSVGQTITGLSDGDVVAVHVDAQAPPNAVASSIFGIEGRECSNAAPISNLFDYTPTQGGNCANVALGAGSAHPVVGVAPPNATGDMSFAVGVGTTTFNDEDLNSHTITCDATHVCKLVVRLSVPSADDYVSFPISFGAAATAPGAPAAPSAVAGNGSAQVSWSAPGSDGGSPVTGYSVVSSPVVSPPVGCTNVLALTCDFTGLTNGVAYTFRVSATNVVGTGPLSSASLPVTPVAPPSGSYFHALTPARILDSRASSQVGPYNSPWGTHTSRDVSVGGLGGVPSGATAVVLNVTVAGPTGSSFLTVWPTGAAQPTASNLNWVPGEVIPNAVTVKLGTGGKVSVFNNSGNVDVIIDVAGYYDSSAGDGFSSLTPARILDSRGSSQVGPYGSPWGTHTSRNLSVGGVAGVPADADAVVLNVTVADTTGSSFLTVWPTGAAQPTASNLNWVPGEVIPNAVTVKLGTSGQVSFFNNSGNVDVIADVAGYYQSGTGKLFHPLTPARVLDSRGSSQVGPYGSPWGTHTSRNLTVGGVAGVSGAADSVVMNVTVADTTGSSFLTVWPTGAAQPTASNLNWVPGEVVPNAVTVKLGTSGQLSIFNNSGNVDVIADVAGWFG